MKRGKFPALFLTATLLFTLLAYPAGAVSSEIDPMPSWNETANKAKIMNFVTNASNTTSRTFVPVKDRIAVFDLDGTLFCEKPLYLQVLIAAEKLYDLANENPLLRGREPYKSCWERNMDYISDSKNFIEMNLRAFKGATEEEYKAYVIKFLTTKKQPRYNVPYIDLFYAPMMELLVFLSDNKFTLFIVSDSPQEFIRSFSEESIKIPRDRVIGTAIAIEFKIRKGKAVFIRENDIIKPRVLKEGKAISTRLRIGRNPILGGGNSNDDIEMLKLAADSGRPSLALTVHHDDAKREYAYDKGADEVLKVAAQKEWVIVSMAKDFKTIFK